jgi:hypothetical protein
MKVHKWDNYLTHLCGNKSFRYGKPGVICHSDKWRYVTCLRCLKKRPKRKTKGRK